jgi:cell division protein FtsW (lipid II flippase)
MGKSTEKSWNRPRYWAATIVLCALLIFSGVLVLRSSTMANELSGELHMPEYLGVWVLPIAQLLAAAIILWRKFPTLRVFAYSWALFYFVLELILLINVQDYALAAFSGFKIVVWAFAFHWDRNRIANSLPKAANDEASASA